MTKNNKRVVYLFGTGATQADASLVDDRIHLGMTYVKEGILKKIVEKNITELEDVRNELAGEYSDVEQLITLYESSNSSDHKKIAKSLRELFREEVLEQIEKLDKSPFAVNGKFTPKLCAALLDMHKVKRFDETLCGIMTLNYEDMIERAAQSVNGRINYLLNFSKIKIKHFKIRKSGTAILKLHGSFNWRNEFPLSVDDNIEKEEDVLWIPPGVEKDNEMYPFNIIWGKARELLNCGILRIIGCSLSRNEWPLISMLYNTQKLNRNKKEYSIEIIGSPKAGDKIREAYPHLGIKRIYEIKEVRDSVIKDLFSLSTTKPPVIEDKTIVEYLKNKNYFGIWLKAKGDDMISRGISLNTPRNLFSNYIRGK